jgi:signal transduction histidine kinase
VTAGVDLPPAVSDSARQRIVERFHQLLSAARSPLLAKPSVAAQVRDQLVSVLDAIPTVDLEAPVGSEPLRSGRDQLSVDIGLTRAYAGIHPTESLRAASYIYEASFPVLSDEFATAGVPQPEIAAGLLLNRAIMDRLCLASKAYVDYLLQKVHNSHVEERHRIGRELHDRAASAVVVGLQSLDLHEVYLDDDPSLADAKLRLARQSLAEALEVIRHLSAESRDAVGTGGLQLALEGYLDNGPPDVRTELLCSGDLESLPGPYAEEIFLVLREATRNALTHANPSTVSIELHMQDFGLWCCVRDDGDGFDVHQPTQGRLGIGLVSMRERVALLGGSLELLSKPHRGTSVEVSVPLSQGPR